MFLPDGAITVSSPPPLWCHLLQLEIALRKTKKGVIWPFPFTRLQAQHRHSILKAIPGLEIATDTVANATNIRFKTPFSGSPKLTHNSHQDPNFMFITSSNQAEEFSQSLCHPI